MSSVATYRTITREQFLLRETRVIARMRLDGASDEQILTEVYAQNALQYPTLGMVKNIAGVCLKRLDGLSQDPDIAHDLTVLLAQGTQEQATQANLYAMMRGYRVVWEFMTGVIAAKYRELDDVLTRADFNAFFADLRQAQPTVAAWSESTIAKSKQVLAKALVDAEFAVPSQTRGTYTLVPVLLDSTIKRAMHANGDTCALAAFNCLEEVD